MSTLHDECPESVSGHDTGGRVDGKCTWCLKQVDSPAPAPSPGRFPTSELSLAYDEYYSPDHGIPWKYRKGTQAE